MSKHTQGPWTVDGAVATENLDVFGEGGRVAMLDFDDIDADTLEANARLIAAAPEMLAALMVAKSEMHYFTATRGSEAHELVRAAIAKATGEEI
jgi:hypothetical protein